MKLNINSARKGNSSFKFNPLSFVSLDFGRLQPYLSYGVLPGDKWSKVHPRGLVRCTPQVFPPYGRMNLKSAAFFVPDSQLCSWSSAFHANNVLWRGQPSTNLPQYNSTDFNLAFISNNYISGLVTLVASNPNTDLAYNTFDFAFPTADSDRALNKTNLDYYKLTPLGWKVYAMLKPLGFDFITFCTDAANQYSQDQHVANHSTRLSVIPLLAYAKVWNDFFCNSYQSDKNVVSTLLQKIYLGQDASDSGNTLYTAATFSCSPDIFMFIAANVVVPYETNMYTNAWNTPNDPTGSENNLINQENTRSLVSPFGRNDDGEFETMTANIDGNSHSTSTSGGFARFTELGHKTLEAFDRFVRRRNLVGSKAVQQLYALFGVEPDEWKKDYVVKLAESSQRIQFSAITSQSDTEVAGNGKPLGAFAGTGLGGYDLSYSYDSSTYGTIINLCWLNVDPVKMHGISPDVLRIKPLDYYSPDFDGKAYRPIPYLEVTGGCTLRDDNISPNATYGYTNMYDDYRYMNDVVAGSFLDFTTRHFAFMRDLTLVRRYETANASDMYPQSSSVQYWALDGDVDMTNPFITAAMAGDRFWLCVDTEVEVTRPMLSSENSFDLEGEGNLTIKKNGDGMA